MAATTPKITLYYMPESPPCRAVQMLASVIDLPLELKYLNLAQGEHLSGELPSVNPCKVVPTIVDDTEGDHFVLWESRAIMSYIVGQYAPKEDDTKGSSLYPRDNKVRAKIDQMLDFDIGTLYSRQSNCFGPLLFGQSIDSAAEAKYKNALDVLNGFLSDSKFVVGNDMTIADISLRCGLSFAEACLFDFSAWKQVSSWMSRVEKTVKNYEEINGEAMKRFTEYMSSKIKDAREGKCNK